MGAKTAIAWTDSTFSPWWGCQRVSPGCEHCYAETFSKRVGLKVWGPKQLGAKPTDGSAPMQLRDAKGGDTAEWPGGLRVQEWPRAG